jgi:hypothetical protein
MAAIGCQLESSINAKARVIFRFKTGLSRIDAKTVDPNDRRNRDHTSVFALLHGGKFAASICGDEQLWIQTAGDAQRAFLHEIVDGGKQCFLAESGVAPV